MPSILTDERVPEGTEPKLAEYLNRMFRDARLSDDQNDQFLVRTKMPEKISIGKPYYFSNAIAGTSINEEGWYFLKSDGEWYHFADICTNGAWEDNTADLTAARVSGGGTPTYQSVNGGGFDAPRIDGSPGTKLLITFHIKHDGKQGSKIYPHIHWTNPSPVLAGETITFELRYQAAKGHQQAQFPTESVITLPYTVPVGGFPAWEHFITEGSNPATQAIDMPEVDTLILMTCQVTSDTLSSNVLGLYVDLHYERERISTKSKAPDFYT